MKCQGHQDLLYTVVNKLHACPCRFSHHNIMFPIVCSSSAQALRVTVVIATPTSSRMGMAMCKPQHSGDSDIAEMPPVQASDCSISDQDRSNSKSSSDRLEQDIFGSGGNLFTNESVFVIFMYF